jgi:hypothetical protein
MWWVLPGLVAGLVAPSLMTVYWFYRLRSVLAEKGWRYTSSLWVIVWIAVFFGSASGLLRMSTVIEEGSAIDSMLLYTSAILYWIALVALVAGMILDVAKRRPNLQHNKNYSSR